MSTFYVIIAALAATFWLAGWLVTFASTDGEGGFFRRHIVRGFVLLFLWPFILMTMLAELG